MSEPNTVSNVNYDVPVVSVRGRVGCRGGEGRVWRGMGWGRWGGCRCNNTMSEPNTVSNINYDVPVVSVRGRVGKERGGGMGEEGVGVILHISFDGIQYLVFVAHLYIYMSLFWREDLIEKNQNN